MGVQGLKHYVCMNTKCTVNDSPGYDVLLEIDMYVRGGLGGLE